MSFRKAPKQVKIDELVPNMGYILVSNEDSFPVKEQLEPLIRLERDTGLTPDNQDPNLPSFLVEQLWQERSE